MKNLWQDMCIIPMGIFEMAYNVIGNPAFWMLATKKPRERNPSILKGFRHPIPNLPIKDPLAGHVPTTRNEILAIQKSYQLRPDPMGNTESIPKLAVVHRSSHEVMKSNA